MTFEIITAAGTLMIDAVRICPIMSGIMFPRMLAYNTMTVPAMVAIPEVISVKISLRLISFRYGRMKSGDSTIPMNILAETPKPSAPPNPMVLCNAQEKDFTTTGRIFQ
jgi:hypothetical protein